MSAQVKLFENAKDKKPPEAYLSARVVLELKASTVDETAARVLARAFVAGYKVALENA